MSLLWAGVLVLMPRPRPAGVLVVWLFVIMLRPIVRLLCSPPGLVVHLVCGVCTHPAVGGSYLWARPLPLLGVWATDFV